MSCELKIIQINTLYSHTIGCCVPIFEGNMDEDNETECMDKIFTDT